MAGRFFGGGNNVEINIIAHDQASGVFGSVGRSLEHAFGNLLSSTVIGGLNLIGDTVGGLASQAVSAASSFQGLQIQLEGLMARELANQYNLAHTVTETTSLVSQLTDEQKGDLASLQFEFEGLSLAVERAEVSYAKMVEKHGEMSIEARTAAHSLEAARQKMEAARLEVDALSSSEGALVTVTRSWVTDTRNAGQMLTEAKEPARALLQWVKEMAVTTPFTVQSLSNTLAMSMALGFTSDEAKILTTSIGDFTAGMGLTDEHLQRIIYNFGQMKTAGKLTGREIRDLTNSLVPVGEILKIVAEKFGVTEDAAKEMLSEGAIPIQEFFDAFVAFSDRDFSGAMERMSGTMATVLSNIQDFIGSIIGGEMLLPLITTFSKKASELLANLMNPENVKKFTSMGYVLDELFKRLLAKLGPLVESFTNLGSAILKAFGIDLGQFNLFDFIWDAAGALNGLIEDFTGFVDWLATLPEKFKTAVSENTVLQDFFADVQTALGNLRDWWLNNGEGFMASLSALGGALAGIGGNLVALALDTLGAALVNLSQALKDNGPTINENIKKIADFMTENKDVIAGFAVGFGAVQVAVVGLNGALSVLAFLLAIVLSPLFILAAVVGILVGLMVYLGDAVLDSFGKVHTFTDSLVFGFWLVAAFLSKLAGEVVAFMWSGIVAGLQLLGIFVLTQVWFFKTLGELAAEVFTALRVAWLQFRVWLTLKWLDLKMWLNTLVSNISAIITFASDPDHWAAIGRYIIQGFWDGIKTKWAELILWLTSAAAGVTAIFTGAWEVKSPSRVFYGIGGNLIEGLEMGMSDRLSRMVGTGLLANQLGTVPAMVGGGSDNSRSYSETHNYGGITINDEATGRRLRARMRRSELSERERLMS